MEGIDGEGKTYTTMSTIGTTTLLGSLVDLDVFDDQVAGVEALCVGVCFGVFEEAEEEFGGFLGPAGFGDAELFSWFRVSFLLDRVVSVECVLDAERSFFIDNCCLPQAPLIPISININQKMHSPCAVRPVLPAYLLIGTASFFSMTLPRYERARWSFQPLIACAVSRVFLKETRR